MVQKVKIEGTGLNKYVISNSKGMKAVVTEFGATLLELHVKDKDGQFRDVVLGFENIDDYAKKGPYIGATIGRCANRIEDAVFELNGTTYNLYKNDGAKNHLHGGKKGFDKKVWDVDAFVEDSNSVTFSYFSEDMEEGYPGNVDVKVTYTVTEDNELILDYEAVSDRDTVVNLTNHTYFNFSKDRKDNILKHKLRVYSDTYTPIHSECIPTGVYEDVIYTPMDFRRPKYIGADIDDEDQQLEYGFGYDHNYVLKDVDDHEMRVFAKLSEEESGITMTGSTTMVGFQLYTGNHLDGTGIEKSGIPMFSKQGVCLETQYFPDSINKFSKLAPILEAGQKYNHRTCFKFGVK